MREINCSDCGAKYETRRSNTKRCRVCQVFRAVEFLQDKTKVCWGCDKEFAPLDGHDVTCGACGVYKERPGTCALCNQETKYLIHEDLRVCYTCGTDPKQRPMLFKALIKKRKANQAKYMSV